MKYVGTAAPRLSSERSSLGPLHDGLPEVALLPI